jgi:hypothetical protein
MAVLAGARHEVPERRTDFTTEAHGQTGPPYVVCHSLFPVSERAKVWTIRLLTGMVQGGQPLSSLPKKTAPRGLRP